jgi:BirA family transcriptional regulator, biotin operon repressor / biotin---[acetyl-CoA-carboxylase] ligase
MLVLLKLIQDGRFHSGQVLGEILGISRAAVWKRLQAIESQFGLVIHSVRGRGYRLAKPLSLLDLALLGGANGECEWPIYLYDNIDSTSAEALRLLAGGAQAPLVVLAERQASGRGRRGRKWVSPFAENLYYSMVWPVVGGSPQLQGLSLVVGLAVLSTLHSFGVVGAGLKWPNDLIVNGRKIAGVLLELVGDLADLCHVVVGVGVNVNMLTVADVIDQPWTSILIETGKETDRNALVREFSVQLTSYLDRYRSFGFGAFIAEWNRSDICFGRVVTLSTGAGHERGVAGGVSETGGLILLVDGERKIFSGGEVSLRVRNDT